MFLLFLFKTLISAGDAVQKSTLLENNYEIILLGKYQQLLLFYHTVHIVHYYTVIVVISCWEFLAL